jgi:hypothetical protein
MDHEYGKLTMHSVRKIRLWYEFWPTYTIRQQAVAQLQPYHYDKQFTHAHNYIGEIDD